MCLANYLSCSDKRGYKPKKSLFPTKFRVEPLEEKKRKEKKEKTKLFLLFFLIFFTLVPKKCKDLNLSLLYILILGTYINFAGKNKFLALGVCFP